MIVFCLESFIYKWSVVHPLSQGLPSLLSGLKWRKETLGTRLAIVLVYFKVA